MNETHITAAWEGLLGAETRALYFADLASFYSRQQRVITGLSFLLSFGAAAALMGRLPVAVPVVLSLTVSAITAYGLSMNLHGKTRTMSKLQHAWSRIESDYRRLWDTTYEPGAEAQLQSLLRSEYELSELAETGAPHDRRRLARWQDQVFRMHHIEQAVEQKQVRSNHA